MKQLDKLVKEVKEHEQQRKEKEDKPPKPLEALLQEALQKQKQKKEEKERLYPQLPKESHDLIVHRVELPQPPIIALKTQQPEEWNEEDKNWAFPPKEDTPKDPASDWEEEDRSATETHPRRSTISEGTSKRPRTTKPKPNLQG